ncbi:MAG TPA: hypothetical protein VG347_05550 [Verrucomicrobiae bacterium]|nr:hypothetical protein [Verrucomicrobiae bacterium]
MASHLIGLLIAFLAHTALLTAALWVMLKLQGLNYNFPGLLGSAVLGGGLDMIPFVGHPLAVTTLYFCIWKMTRASMFPDAAFTVVVAYALMFAFNVLVLTALIGDLRPDLHPAKAGGPYGDTNMVEESLAAQTNATVVTNPAPVSKAAKLAVKDLVIKGVTRNGDNSSVAIKAGAKTYFAPVNKITLIQTEDGVLSVRPTALGDTTLTLEINGESLSLPLP